MFPTNSKGVPFPNEAMPADEGYMGFVSGLGCIGSAIWVIINAVYTINRNIRLNIFKLSAGKIECVDVCSSTSAWSKKETERKSNPDNLIVSLLLFLPSHASKCNQNTAKNTNEANMFKAK